MKVRHNESEFSLSRNANTPEFYTNIFCLIISNIILPTEGCIVCGISGDVPV